MLSSERNGDLESFTAKMEESNDQARSPAHCLSSVELDGRIKNLASTIEARLLSRVGFLDEFTQLRALLNAQLARAQILANELPATYLPPADRFPVAHPNLADDRTPLSE